MKKENILQLEKDTNTILCIETLAHNELLKAFNNDNVEEIVNKFKDAQNVIDASNISIFALCINGVNSTALADIINNGSVNHINELKRQGLTGYIYNDDINYVALANYYLKQVEAKKIKPITYNQLCKAILDKVVYNERATFSIGDILTGNGYELKFIDITQSQKNITCVYVISKDSKTKELTTGTTDLLKLLKDKLNIDVRSCEFKPRKIENISAEIDF